MLDYNLNCVDPCDTAKSITVIAYTIKFIPSLKFLLFHLKTWTNPVSKINGKINLRWCTLYKIILSLLVRKRDGNWDRGMRMCTHMCVLKCAAASSVTCASWGPWHILSCPNVLDKQAMKNRKFFSLLRNY
jgi:hypothetical protein